MQRPMSRKNVAASSYRAPNVSIASGTKLIAQCCAFRSFAVLGVNGDCTGSKLMLDAGGLWPACLDMWSPTPSTCRMTMTLAIIPRQTRRLQSGTAAVSARFMRSLTVLCREWRPADRRHDRPWWPYWSTFSLQTHSWVAQIGTPT